MKRALFFTVKYTIDDDTHPDYLPGVAAAMDAACGAGLLRIAIHHEPGDEALHSYLAKMLKRELGVSYFAFCGHGKDDGCLCQKPSPMLILRAAKAMGVATAHSAFVGSSYDDVGMARAADIAQVNFVVPNTGGFADAVHRVVLPWVGATPLPPGFERS